MTSSKERFIILLTLERHKSGIWMTELQQELQELGLLPVKIVTLESVLGGTDGGFLKSAMLVVNRVSDAAEPHLVKACCGVLGCCANLNKVPVWNGGDSYALCSNKWCQHALLDKAELQTPNTIRFFEKKLPVAATLSSLSYPILLKPNSGGFGAGIVKCNSTDELESSLREAQLSDGMGLLQEFIEVDRIYRVWWLREKVQCGLIRETTSPDQFTDGCAASGVCSLSSHRRRPPVFRAYKIPCEVRAEIETKLLPLIPTAHCGSVEFLVDQDGSRLYFDVNLLSTLPIVETVKDNEQVWGENYNPWRELATSVIDFCR